MSDLNHTLAKLRAESLCKSAKRRGEHVHLNMQETHEIVCLVQQYADEIQGTDFFKECNHGK